MTDARHGRSQIAGMLASQESLPVAIDESANTHFPGKETRSFSRYYFISAVADSRLSIAGEVLLVRLKFVYTAYLFNLADKLL